MAKEGRQTNSHDVLVEVQHLHEKLYGENGFQGDIPYIKDRLGVTVDRVDTVEKAHLECRTMVVTDLRNIKKFGWLFLTVLGSLFVSLFLYVLATPHQVIGG